MPTTLTTASFIVLVILVTGMLVVLAGRGSKAPMRARLVACAAMLSWLGLTFAIAQAGVLRDVSAMPPTFMRFMAMSTVLVIALAASNVGERMARGTPLAALVGMQFFRFPLELLLHRLHVEGALPVQMTFAGRNFDILTGLLAVPVAVYIARRGQSDVRAQRLALAFNLLGLGLLVNIVTVAVLSVPGPLRVFMNEPANTLVMGVPYVWLPTVLVLTALLGHLLVFRTLRASVAAPR